jgi:hypothetical protein
MVREASQPYWAQQLVLADCSQQGEPAKQQGEPAKQQSPTPSQQGEPAKQQGEPSKQQLLAAVGVNNPAQAAPASTTATISASAILVFNMVDSPLQG